MKMDPCINIYMIYLIGAILVVMLIASRGLIMDKKTGNNEESNLQNEVNEEEQND